MKSLIFVFTALVLALSCTRAEQPATPPSTDDEFAEKEGGESVSSLEAVNVECVARVIGNTPAGENLPNPNATLKRFNMASTDYGNMWDAGNGQLWCMFGDNFNDLGGD